MKKRRILFIICLLMALTVKADEVSYYFWKGKIDGNEVKMACAVKDDVMTGELFQNIEGGTYVYNVAGMKTGNMFDIKVYHDVEGNIIHTYFIRAEIKNGNLVGITQNEEKKFTLKKYSDPYAYPIDAQQGLYSSPYVEGKVFHFKEWGHGGEYLYTNHMGVSGELTLWYKPETESFTLSIRRDSEANGAGNDALVDISGIHPDENTGSFNATLSGCDYRFSVRFHDHFLIIRPLSGSPSKCFGSGASIVGIYIMLPAKG